MKSLNQYPNLTQDGRWTYTWDAENRLVRLVANTGVGPQQRLDFTYDSQGRRIGKKVWNNTGGTGSPAVELQFVYDGWNLVAELTPAHAALRAYTWGLDLSGSEHGAGGVGGLISMTVHQGANAGTYFYACDGNGNVVALVNPADSSVAARYEYDAFGKLLRATGPLAFANPFGFSTKYQDDETGLLYYGYRYYDPDTGRWPNRDPIEERGGLNVYAFVSGDPINKIDKLGLASSTTPGTPHVSWSEHDNYLTFSATCPAGWSVTAVRVTYDGEGMAHGLLVWAASSEERRQHWLNYDYGGIKSVGRSNCRGEPVEVLAFMRTRLVSPNLLSVAYRTANGLPDADTIVALYQANTQIHWLGNNCCGRGTSTR